MSKSKEIAQVKDSCDSTSKFLFSYKPGLDTNIYGEFQNEFERLAIRTFLTRWPMILEQTREAGIPEEVIDTVKADFSWIW